MKPYEKPEYQFIAAGWDIVTASKDGQEVEE